MVMKRVCLLIGCLLVMSGCKEATKKKVTAKADVPVIASYKAGTMDVPFYEFKELETFLHKNDDKTYVINFWATWCKPCIKELPYFEELNANYSDSNVEVLLVSLDFPKDIESKLLPFIKEKQLKSQVVILNDVKSNIWIPKVDAEWSGAIPATVIYNKDKRKFYERSFTYDELETEVKQFLN